MKIMLFIGVSLLISISLPGQRKVTPELATSVAENFIAVKANDNNLVVDHLFPLRIKEVIKERILVYYWFDMANDGFIVIAADFASFPVIAYSFDPVERDEKPKSFTNRMEQYGLQILEIKSKKLTFSTDIADTWEKLGSGLHRTENKATTKGVFPLTTSKWGQRVYYNAMCPNDPSGPGGRAIAGCVATALAQVMFYYRYPATGEGSHGYMSDYGQEFADFGNTAYNWDAMVNRIYGQSNPAIAELIYHSGVAVEMDYGANSSGAMTSETVYALKTYFRYGEQAEYVTNYELGDAFYDTIRANLDQRQVVIYRGGDLGASHSFVCDGYQDSSFFHFNWGWEGSYNGYFYRDNLNPNIYDFSFNQGAVINIYPEEDYPPFCQGTKVLTSQRGTLVDGSGSEKYQNGQTCSWLIEPEGITGQIQFWFTTLETEDGKDMVYIYDGATVDEPLMGMYSGTEIPPLLVSSGNKMLVVFETDTENTMDGWSAEYIAYNQPFCSPDNIYSSFNRAFFSDGSGPYYYTDNSNCNWLIFPQSNTFDSVSSLQMYFHDFELAEGDTLFIFDGEDDTSVKLGSYTGSAIPDTITSSGNKLYMNFTSDDYLPGKGWSAGYTSILPTYCMDTTELFNKTAIIEDGSLEKNYSPNTNCYWRIKWEEAELITFEFIEFDLEHGYDQLRFYDANHSPPTLFATYWGHSIPEDVKMFTNDVLIHFSTDGSSEFDGWMLQYNALAPGITESRDDRKVVLFPNPARNQLNIHFSHPAKRLDIQICTPDMGNILPATLKKHNQYDYKLDLNHISPGVYFVLFSTEKERFVKKLVVSK